MKSDFIRKGRTASARSERRRSARANRRAEGRRRARAKELKDKAERRARS